MILFVIVLIALFCVSLLRYNKSGVFDKSITDLLKSVMPIVIILGHLSYRVGLGWIQPFRSWGAPFVSVFFFISGYGLFSAYMKKGVAYLDGFFKKRILRVLLPLFVTISLYYIVIHIPQKEYLLNLLEQVKTGTSSQSHLWYVYALVLLYFVFYLAFKFVPEKWRIVTLTCFTVVVLCVLRAIGYDRCWYVGLLAFPAGVVYSYFERYLVKNIFSRRFRYALMFVGCLAMIALLYVTQNVWCYCLTYIFIPLAVIMAFSHICYPVNKNKVTSLLSKYSYEI